MSAVPVDLAAKLRKVLRIRRAIETGTFRGDGTEALRSVFRKVISIEVNEPLYREACRRFDRRRGITILHGDSAELLPDLVDPSTPAFYWLDGHLTLDVGNGDPGFAPPENECPVLAELAAIANGHPDDCVVIDDARFFEVSPPSPHDPAKWPELMEIMEALKSATPERHVTVIADYIVAVPRRAKPRLDDIARGWLGTEGWSSPG